MNSFKSILITVTVIFLIAGIADAAKKKQAAEKPKKAVAESNVPAVKPNPPTAEPNAPAADANLSSAVTVTVNGVKITEGQINKVLQAKMEQLASRIPPNMKDQYRQQVRKRIVEVMTIEELLAQKEKEKNIVASPAEVNEQISKQMTKDNLTIDDFKSLLKAYGTDFSEYQKDMRKKIMFEKLMEDQFNSKVVKPTDEQVKTYYDQNIQQFQEPEKIHTKHILIRPEDSNDPNQAKAKAKAKAKAEDILKKLKAGADFNDMAKQYSACPSSKQGGDLGTQPKGTFVPEFEKAAYALKPGQMTDVVETQFGFHIIKLIEHANANTVSFAQSKDMIAQLLTNEQKKTIVENYIEQIKKTADIKFTNPADGFADVPKAVAPVRPSSDKTEPNSKK